MSEPTGEMAAATSGIREAGSADTEQVEHSTPDDSTPEDTTPGSSASDGSASDGTAPDENAASESAQDEAAAPGRAAATRGLAVSPARRHWLFALALAGAAALRAVVMLGYPPIIWFHDSYSYVETAVSHHVSTVRPGGYPFFLLLVEPLHSFVVVALLQHLMGLGAGVAIYAVLRRRGLAGWAATLAALPVLFDAYQVQLEQMVMSDALFMLMLTLAIVILCWNDKVGPVAAAVAGLLIGYATLVRSAGVELLVGVGLCLLVRRVGWRSLVALVIAVIVPLAGYAAVYHAEHGQFATTESDGIFLYGRVQAFADCAVIKPPASLRVLCDPRPPASRPIATEYIWEQNPLYKFAPNGGFFTPKLNAMAEKFAERAILAQPVSYLKVVARDTMRSFFWTRTLQYDGKTDVYYLFTHRPPYIASYRPWHDIHVYQPGLGQTKAVQPFAGFLIGYQRVVYLRGVLLGLILLLGLAGVVARWRRWGGAVLLPWLVAVMLLVLPVATSGFSYRYELAVVPFACLAAGLAVARARQAGESSESEAPAGSGQAGSGRRWPAKIGRKPRGGRTVEQE